MARVLHVLRVGRVVHKRRVFRSVAEPAPRAQRGRWRSSARPARSTFRFHFPNFARTSTSVLPSTTRVARIHIRRIVLPTGCGMAHVAASVDHRVLIVVLCEQMIEVLASFGLAPTAATMVGGGRDRATDADIDAARVVVTRRTSSTSPSSSTFSSTRRTSSADLVDDSELGPESPAGSSESSDTSDSTGLARDGYAAVRAATTLASARLFSATLDVPDGAERCAR